MKEITRKKHTSPGGCKKNGWQTFVEISSFLGVRIESQIFSDLVKALNENCILRCSFVNLVRINGASNPKGCLFAKFLEHPRPKIHGTGTRKVAAHWVPREPRPSVASAFITANVQEKQL